MFYFMTRSKITPLPFFVLAVCLVSTALLWQFTKKNLDQRAKARFDNQRRSIQLRIQKRLDLYVNTLYGAKALFAASKEVDRDEWMAFMRSQNLTERYPGLLEIEYVEYVTADELPSFVERVRYDTSLNYAGYPNFAVYPAADKSEYYVANYIYPFEENKLLFGLDIGSDAIRLRTLKAACDSGSPEFTPRLLLRQHNQVGFLIFMPVYMNHHSTRTVAERRAVLTGFVVGSVGAESLFKDLYEDYTGTRDIDFEIYDGDALTPNNLLYDSNAAASLDDKRLKPRFGVTVPFEVPGRRWTLRFMALSTFQLEGGQEQVPLFVLLGGALFSFLLFGILYSLSTSRQRAVALAHEMTEDLRRLGRIQSEFISTVSHELRTPLAVIKESVAIIEEGMIGPVNSQQRDLIETAKSNVDRLARLINAVLDYQKLDSHLVEFHKVPNDLNALVREVVKGFVPVARSRGLQLKTELAPGIPKPVFDKDKITQVLMNLMNNAVKFTDKGQITVQTAFENPNAVRVSVKDEGIGISPEDIPKLFKSFSQTSDGHKKTGGTGLGLAISKKIVDAHQGMIGVESAYRQGSCFYVILPVHPE